MTAAAIGAAYAVNQSQSTAYRSDATVLVEARVTPDTTPVLPDLGTERELALSDAVVVPAAQRISVSREALLEGLTVETIPGANVLTFRYTADNQFSAQVRARALVESYVSYRRAGTLTSPTLVTSPDLPAEPEPGRPLGPDLAIGLAAGLVLGAGTALLRARTRGRIRSREDLAKLSGTKVLATVPRTRRPAGTTTGLPVVLREPDSAAAESYRYLRNRLQPVLRTTSTTTILVTSPGDREGRSTVAANLAVALAQAGRSVVLVDADLRRPTLHDVFQLPGEYGLTTLLDGDATVSEVLEETSVPRLRLIPAGHRTDDHVDLLESPQLARVLRAVQKHADVVVLDSAAVLSASDGIALAAMSDQVLMVGDFRRTRRRAVTRALAELDEVLDGNVSTVLLNVPRSAGGLTPRVRSISTGAAVPFRYSRRTTGGLVRDAEDSAPPGITAHAYLDEADEAAEQPQSPSQYAVPVIYGAAAASTVYSSSSSTPLAASDVEPISAVPVTPAAPAVSEEAAVPSEDESDVTVLVGVPASDQVDSSDAPVLPDNSDTSDLAESSINASSDALISASSKASVKAEAVEARS